jgi:UDP-N-acetylmuramoyl-tripeptide--D-alanyl-D-alanine ligase
MHPFSASWICLALDLRVDGVETHPGFSRICTDSRQTTPEALFVALAGENFDGHDFIPDLLKRGVRGVICKKGTKRPQNVEALFFEVDDTLQAYRDLARAWRQRFPKLPVIAVAGSVGKTTTKELLAAALRGRGLPVLATEGSQNGFVGIPMTLLELRKEHSAAVIEVGIDEPHAMERHLAVVQPSASLLTAISEEHLEKLGTLERVTEEELFALRTPARKGALVGVNLDDSRIATVLQDVDASWKAIAWSLEGRSTSLMPVYRGTYKAPSHLSVRSPEGSEADFDLPLEGRHNAANALAAVALARETGARFDEIARGLSEHFKPAFGRSEFRNLTNDIPALCDFYNANPASMRAAFELARTRAPKRLFLVLGDMLELGSNEKALHCALLPDLVSLHPQGVAFFGPRMGWLSEQCLSEPTLSKKVFHSMSAEQIAQWLHPQLKPGDLLLLKGSRGMRLENIYAALEKLQC